MKGTYIGDQKMLISPAWGGKLVIPSNDLSLAPDLIISGVLESPLTKYFVQNVKHGDLVIDVGANIGYFSVLLGYLVGSQGKVYSFEANKFIYDFLVDNLSINYLHDRTEHFNLAVYSEEKDISFFLSRRYMGNSSIHSHSEEYKKHYKDNIEEIKIPTVVLDRMFSNVERIDYLKIDIEGGEYHAFKGMECLIKSNKINNLVFELNKSMMQGDWNDFRELLLELDLLNKKFYLLSEEGSLIGVKVEELIAKEGYPYVLMKNT
ncbi:FkbM family methyltransferase [Paenibacillus sp. YPG26]|uniref:FkbM family methyltransferase n=1 Tax=Paenibacillus sp. YPG26 TaxID=2878915 RepID=UPI00204028A6|nr:FkbM family methyltransferase [Paenibacillus sp. YPG26]USB32834.1 FkbM family methyltransferase [Paenibacillus sp. YPG26]